MYSFCSFRDSSPLPIVAESRLLGILLDKKLSWWPLVRDLRQRASAKVWSLLKLRDAGATQEQLVQLYVARVHSTLEYAAQVYTPLLNASQAMELESVQRKCLQIVLGPKSKSYEDNMATLGLDSLAVRRSFLVKTVLSLAIARYSTVGGLLHILPCL